MSYVDKLDKAQLKNINLILSELDKKGIKNKLVQTAVLAVFSKESEFKPVKENCHYKTPNNTLRNIFKNAQNLSDSELDNLKKDCVAFFNKMYGGMLKNNFINDGYTYRGRGFVQLTGKGNYEHIGKQIKENLVNNPDLMLKPEIAAKASAQFIENGLKDGKSKFKTRYNITDPYNPTTLKQASDMVFNIVAGLGKDVNSSKIQESWGYRTMNNRINDLAILVKKNPQTENNFIASSWVIGLIAFGTYFFTKIKGS